MYNIETGLRWRILCIASCIIVVACVGVSVVVVGRSGGGRILFLVVVPTEDTCFA
jgi:hypothetical protein